MDTATYLHLSSCIRMTVQHADSLLIVLFMDSPWLRIILLNLENGLRDKNWNPCVSCWVYKPPTPPFQNDFGDTISDEIGHKVQFAGTQPNMAIVVLHNWINNLVINLPGSLIMLSCTLSIIDSSNFLGRKLKCYTSLF